MRGTERSSRIGEQVLGNCKNEGLGRLSSLSLPISLYQLTKLPIYQLSSSFARMPGVDAACPEKKAFSVVTDLLDDVGFIGQFHNADGFLAQRWSGAQKSGRGMFDQVSLARFRVTPPLRTVAMNDGQNLFPRFNVWTFLMRCNHHGFAWSRNESMVGVLNGPVGKLAIHVSKFARRRPDDDGKVL